MTEWSGSPAVRGASFYAVSDGNGNVSVLVDADSAAGPVETLEYGPFGRVVAQHRSDAGAVPAAVPSRCPFVESGVKRRFKKRLLVRGQTSYI